MQRVFCFLVLVACTQDRPPPASPLPSTAAVEDVAQLLVHSALAGDRVTARALSLSYDDLLQISNKARERKAEDWNEAVNEGIEHIGRDTAERPTTIGDINVVIRGELTPDRDEKVMHVVEYARVHVALKSTYPQGMTLLFLRTPSGWRYSPRN